MKNKFLLQLRKRANLHLVIIIIMNTFSIILGFFTGGIVGGLCIGYGIATIISVTLARISFKKMERELNAVADKFEEDLRKLKL